MGSSRAHIHGVDNWRLDVRYMHSRRKRGVRDHKLKGIAGEGVGLRISSPNTDLGASDQYVVRVSSFVA